jgi:hypothetical protein
MQDVEALGEEMGRLLAWSAARRSQEISEARRLAEDMLAWRRVASTGAEAGVGKPVPGGVGK